MKTKLTCFLLSVFICSSLFSRAEELQIGQEPSPQGSTTTRTIKNKIKRVGNWIERKTGAAPAQSLEDLRLDLADEKIKLEKSRKDSLGLQEKLRDHIEKSNQKKLDLEQEIVEKEREVDFHQNKVNFYERQILEITN